MRVCVCVCVCVRVHPLSLTLIACVVVLSRVHLSCVHRQVESIKTWLKWNKTKVMAELLVVPITSSKTKEKLPSRFYNLVYAFKRKRCKANEALLAELRKVACDSDNELSDAVSELKGALEASDGDQHVPSVLVVFRNRLKTALGDVFGGIMGRTVEGPKGEWEEESEDDDEGEEDDDEDEE